MCIYCGTAKYRKIYEQHFGPIPQDEEGRTYDVHHIDGNRQNNNPENLQSLSIREHYDIHYDQQDWMACFRIAQKLKLSPTLISELSSMTQKARIESGNHPFIDPIIRQKNNKETSDRNRRNVENGTHPFLDNDIQELRKQGFQKMIRDTDHQWHKSNVCHAKVANGTHIFQNKEWAKARSLKQVQEGTHHLLGANNPVHQKVKDGTHNFIGGAVQQRRLDEGRHNFTTDMLCPHCGKHGKGAAMIRWHFNNCSKKSGVE